MATTTATQIQQLYVGLLGRAADQGGLNWWVDQVTTGGRTLEDIRASFVTSTEYTTTYGAATTRTDLVTAIYSNLFERTPSADELAYWVSTDTRPADQLVTAFLEFASTADQAVINNKTFVAQTYTDTVGADFNAATAAAVIANVDGTSASVSVALENLNSGSLPGQVPGVGLINGLAAAQAAQATYETANKAAVDALAVKFDIKDAAYDALSFTAQLAAVKGAADTARVDAGTTGGTPEASTSVLEIRVADAKKALETARAAEANKTDAAAYEAAYAKNISVKGAAANDVLAATAGLDAVTTTSAKLGDLEGVAALEKAGTAPDFSPTTGSASQALYDYYVAADTTAAQRQIIDAKFADTSFYTTFKTTAVIDVADKAAVQALADAAAKVGTPFENAVKAVADASATFEAAKLADADKAAADALTTSHDAAVKAVTDAGDALDTYNSTHTDTKVVELGTVAASDTVKEAFYFAEKATAANDFTIGTAAVATSHFGAGDAIVLGAGYSFNSGALSTGDNNKLEFFFVKTDAGTQVVIETANFGSAAATPSATTGVAPAANDNLAVITLTGVTADHLSVNNGVISYV